MRRGQIRDELGGLPIDSDVETAPTTHPLTLIRAHADLLPVIAVGGAIGSVARWGVGRALPHAASAFAWSTALINVAGALALGILMALVLDVWAHTRYVRPFVGVGVLGGFTTYSTFMLDARDEIAGGHLPTMAAYVAVSVLGGLAAVAAGLTVTRAVADRFWIDRGRV